MFYSPIINKIKNKLLSNKAETIIKCVDAVVLFYDLIKHINNQVLLLY